MKITPRKYAQALVEALEGNNDPGAIVKNLLLFLRKKKQFKLLPKILQSFEEQWSERRGIFKVTVMYPPKFQNTLAELEQKLKEKLGKSVEMKKIPVEGLIGGFKVHAKDSLIDASILGKLKALERRINQ